MQSLRLRGRPALPISPRVIRYEPDFLLFASDADLLALWGLAFLVLAGVALAMERRRMKRARINRVGWVPWTGVFMACAVTGGGLIAVAMPGILQG